jgi:tyrosinase
MGQFQLQLARVALLLIGSSAVASAAPTNFTQPACVKRVQHKPWGMLTQAEQTQYIEATLCLMDAPAKADIPGAKTLWDELQYNHIINAHAVHDVGHFLPWHRSNLAIHGQLMRDECGYDGPLPYWDETADAGLTDLNESVIFQKNSFGGNGSGPDGYITDGPFANSTLRMRPKNQTPEDHHIYRNFNETRLVGASQPVLDSCFAIKTYASFWECLGGMPHGAGHGGAGGLMNDVQASPGDPLFYLHHGWLDAMWWKWQTMDLTVRLTDMGGRNTPLPSYVGRLGLPFPGREFTSHSGDPADITTLDHVLYNGGIAANVTVGQVMDVRGAFVCADYIFSDDLKVTVNTVANGKMTTASF